MLLDEVMPGATLGELSALEAILARLAAPADRRLAPARLMRPLLAVPMAEYRRLISGAGGTSATNGAGGGGDGGAAAAAAEEDAAAAAASERRATRLAFQLMALLAAASPEDAVAHLHAVATIGFSRRLADPAVQRHACAVLAAAAPALRTPAGARELAAAAGSAGGAGGAAGAVASGEAAREALLRDVYEGIARVLLSDAAGAASDANWPAAAEAAVAALYALHPRPAALAGAVLERLARAAGLADGERGFRCLLCVFFCLLFYYPPLNPTNGAGIRPGADQQ